MKGDLKDHPFELTRAIDLGKSHRPIQGQYPWRRKDIARDVPENVSRYERASYWPEIGWDPLHHGAWHTVSEA